MPTRLARHLLLLCSTMLLSACASSPSEPANEPPPAAVVKMHLHSFEPKAVTIHPGQAVRWENHTIIWHTVTADPALAKKPEDAALPPGAEPFDSGKINPGKTYEHTFATPGTYRYFCQPHELKGMVGEVVVK